jgi:dihydrofolate reductase
MGKVSVSTFVTLDGGMQDPGGTGEFDRGGWQIQFFEAQAGLIARDSLFKTDALLLGRVTYEHLAAAWPGMTDEEGYAGRMNGIPKFVASRTLKQATWKAAVIKDAAADVAALKQERDLLVMGSGQLVGTLRDHDPRRRLGGVGATDPARRRQAAVRRRATAAEPYPHRHQDHPEGRDRARLRGRGVTRGHH